MVSLQNRKREFETVDALKSVFSRQEIFGCRVLVISKLSIDRESMQFRSDNDRITAEKPSGSHDDRLQTNRRISQQRANNV